MKRIALSAMLIIIFGAAEMSAQDDNLRVLLHPTFALTKNWFVSVWVIGNAKTQTPNNVNVITGIGYRHDTWWVEGMVQRQWVSTGDQWFMNFRLSKNKGRLNLYAEPAIFLTNPAFQESAFVEYRVWRKLALGGETENTHRPNARDTLGMGPRVSYALPSWKKIRPVVALTYQVRKQEGDVLRLYVVFNRRF